MIIPWVGYERHFGYKNPHGKICPYPENHFHLEFPPNQAGETKINQDCSSRPKVSFKCDTEGQTTHCKACVDGNGKLNAPRSIEESSEECCKDYTGRNAVRSLTWKLAEKLLDPSVVIKKAEPEDDPNDEGQDDIDESKNEKPRKDNGGKKQKESKQTKGNTNQETKGDQEKGGKKGPKKNTKRTLFRDANGVDADRTEEAETRLLRLQH
jgi:hypothetical protein